MCFVREFFALLYFAVYEDADQRGQSADDRDQATTTPPDGAELYSSADGGHCDDETKTESDLLAEDIGVYDAFLESLTMVVLTLGHFDDSIGGTGDDFVIPLENLGRRKRTRESARNLCCDSYKSCLFLALSFGTHQIIFISPL